MKQFLIDWKITNKYNKEYSEFGGDFCHGLTAENAIEKYLLDNDNAKITVFPNEYQNRELLYNNNGEGIGYFIDMRNGYILEIKVYGIKVTETWCLEAYDITIKE